MEDFKNDFTLLNVISFLKYKTYVLSQVDKKEIIIKLLDESLMTYEIINATSFREYKILITYNDLKCIFNVIFLENLKKKINIKIEDDINLKEDDNTFYYPEHIIISTKTDSKELKIFNEQLFSIHIKHALFLTEKETVEIKLITTKMKNRIKNLASSNYSDHVLYNNSISNNEYIFKLFYFPPYINESDMAGIEYKSSDMVGTYVSDYRFCKPPKPSS